MRKRRLVAALAGIGSCLVLLCAAVVVPMQADASWQAMHAEVTELTAELRAAPIARQVLWGEPEAGNAHAHYERALAAARALQQDHHDELVATLRDTDEHVALQRRDLRERWQPVLTALRAGAAATDGSAPLPGDQPAEPRTANLLDCRWVANAAVFEARALRYEGRGLEAVQHTLDAAALGRDLVRRGVLIDQMIGCATLAIATSEAWPESALEALDGDALDLLATGLARLDADLPTTLDDRVERLFMAWHIRNAAGDANWLPSTASAWRFGFSMRWMLADAFLRQDAMARRLAAQSGEPWPERAARWDRECAAAVASGNPILAVCLPNLPAAEGNWREQVGRVRLLRMSVDLHRGEPAPALPDPLSGAPIQVAADAAGTTLTCESCNGRTAATRFVRR